MSLTRDILLAHGASEKGYAPVRVDAVLGPDPQTALLAEDFDRLGLRVREPEKALFVADHFAPPASVDRANILKRFLRFTESQGVSPAKLHDGICHQVLVEDPRCAPGSVVVGGDSHTVMGGALGAFATGLGSTDLLFALATGTTYLKIPAARRLTLVGALGPGVSGRDLILTLLGEWGEGGALYEALEFEDRSEGGLSADQRFAVCNMAVEAGAKSALFLPDAVTAAYLRARGDGAAAIPPEIDESDYVSRREIDLSRIAPAVACPHSPANVRPASETDAKVDQVFVGSCAGGRLEDLRDAALALGGRRVARGVRMIVIPASTRVYRDAMADGALAALLDAGAVVSNPSCGPCGGIDKGLLADGDVCVSTSNRNFRGRMGSPEAFIYLASARTAGAAAAAGRIVDPREAA